MRNLINKIDHRLSLLNEDVADTSWKDPSSTNYDRQVAEDALYHTLGPLTETPRWAGEWTSPSPPVPGFAPNGSAPRWTPEEVVMAYAGDPDLLDGSTSGNPRSPKYGRGGSPLYRQANRQTRRFGRSGDFQALMNAFSNGLLGLTNIMRAGYDEGRTGFISFASRHIEGAIVSGSGATQEGIRAAGAESKSGLRGLRSVLGTNDPSQIREIANQVKGKYQSERSTDKNKDNPFGIYSSRFYKVSNDYADAIESGDQDKIESSKSAVKDLIDTINDESVAIRGIGTGSEQAISTPDRATSVKISSINAPKETEEGMQTSGLANKLEQKESAPMGGIEPEAITYILQTVLENDLGAVVGNIPRYQQIAADAGAEVVNGIAKIGGKMTANEYRYTLRQLGTAALNNYPGDGVMRSNTSKPRDAANWWKPGEDTEIEPIPSGGTWTSIWKRSGGPEMGPTEIAAEMTQEVKEFNKLGIATARSVKAKASPTGAVKEEAVSKVAVFAAVKSAYVKLKVAAYLYKLEEEDDDLEEGVKKTLRPILESIDPVDRRLINEAFDFILVRLRDNLIRQYI